MEIDSSTRSGSAHKLSTQRYLAAEDRRSGGEGGGSRHNGRGNGGTHVHDSYGAKTRWQALRETL